MRSAVSSRRTAPSVAASTAPTDAGQRRGVQGLGCGRDPGRTPGTDRHDVAVAGGARDPLRRTRGCPAPHPRRSRGPAGPAAGRWGAAARPRRGPAAPARAGRAAGRERWERQPGPWPVAAVPAAPRPRAGTQRQASRRGRSNGPTWGSSSVLWGADCRWTGVGRSLPGQVSPHDRLGDAIEAGYPSFMVKVANDEARIDGDLTAPLSEAPVSGVPLRVVVGLPGAAGRLGPGLPLPARGPRRPHVRPRGRAADHGQPARHGRACATTSSSPRRSEATTALRAEPGLLEAPGRRRRRRPGRHRRRAGRGRAVARARRPGRPGPAARFPMPPRATASTPRCSARCSTTRPPCSPARGGRTAPSCRSCSPGARSTTCASSSSASSTAPPW